MVVMVNEVERMMSALLKRGADTPLRYGDMKRYRLTEQQERIGIQPQVQ